MSTLPLAWIVSILTSIAAFALSQDTRIPFLARFFFCAFLLTLATAGLLLGLRLSFDTTWAADLQPLVAVMIAPSAYLGFKTLTQNGASEWRKPLLVNGVPIVLTQVAIMSDCHSARHPDPTRFKYFKGLSCRSASNPYTDLHSIYAARWPDGAAPSPTLRTMTRDAPDPLPDDLPNARTQSAGFMARLLWSWICMGFRNPVVADVRRTFDA